MPPALPPRVRFCSLCGSSLADGGCSAARCGQLGAAPEEGEEDNITGAEVGAVVGDALDFAAGLANVARNALRGLAKVNARAGGPKREGPIPR